MYKIGDRKHYKYARRLVEEISLKALMHVHPPGWREEERGEKKKINVYKGQALRNYLSVLFCHTTSKQYRH